MTPISNAEKRERLNRLSEEQWLRWAYVPFVIAEGAWDYADTVINIAAQMKLSETKKLCRAVRELKRGYDGRRRQHAMKSSGYEMDNFIIMESIAKSSFKYMNACIDESVKRQHPGLSEDYQSLLSAVYACLAVLEVLYRYMSVQEARVCEVCGFGEMSSILPPEMHALRRLMPEFAGDKPVKVKGRGLFVRNLVNKFCSVQLTESKEEAGLA